MFKAKGSWFGRAPGRDRDVTRDGTAETLLQWFRGGLVVKAHRLLYHSTLGLRVSKKKKNLVAFVPLPAVITDSSAIGGERERRVRCERERRDNRLRALGHLYVTCPLSVCFTPFSNCDQINYFLNVIFTVRSAAGCRSLATQTLELADLLRIDVKRFREGLVFKARRLLYHSTLGRE